MFKKLLFLLFLVLVIKGFALCQVLKEDYKLSYDISVSTNYQVSVSSTAVTTFSSIGDTGIERIFFVETTSGSVWWLRDVSTTTVVTNGMSLTNGTYLKEDSYMGTLNFQGKAGASAVTLSYKMLKRT